VRRDGETVSEAAVYMQMVRPLQDQRGIWHEAEPVEEGLFVAAGDELDEEGYWLTLVDVAAGGAGDDVTRFVFEWEIDDDATVIESIPPRPQHWLALGAVMLALGWVVYPAYRRFVGVLNLNALTVSIILAALLGTAAITWVTYAYIQRVQTETALVLNPEPQVTNPVLPDARSLREGAELYAAHCDWEQDARVFASLVERLPRTRDEELFAFTRGGWRSLPACDAGGALTDEDRWHIVNYVRTFEHR
jgi:hypothetical protein